LFGDPGTSASFDGSSGYVSVPENASLDVGNTFAVEAWVKRGSVSTSGYQAIASKQTGSWVLAVNSVNQLVLRQAGNADIVTSTKNISDTSSWHYVAATKNGSSVHLYIDGADVTGTVANQTLSNNTQPLVIGQSSGGSFFKGQIEEVAVYNQVLTPAQVLDHYQLGTAPCSPKVSTYSQGLPARAGRFRTGD
jgi:Concanavalin A-like lectin/glucanases superfamily